MSACLSDHDLEAFVGQGASQDRMAAWKSHLATCESCLARVARREHVTADDSDTDPDATVTVKPVGKPNVDAGAASASADAIPGYRILKELHRGGQGVVYQAVQESTKRMGPRPASRQKKQAPCVLVCA